MDKKQKNEKINLLLKIAMALLFLTGAVIFSYPFVASAINAYYDQKMIAKNQQAMAAVSKKNQARLKKERMQRNKELAENKQMTNIPGTGLVADPFAATVGHTEDPGEKYYEKHVVGAVFIPKIGVSLPLFDETNQILLAKGATVLQGTSFPVGGKNTHAVISAHSGLPDKKMFTDLEKLKLADSFYVTVGNEKLAYQVDAIEKVLPTAVDKLVIQPNRDLVTLLTCTPYGINTHRLLVTGHRIPYDDTMAEEITQTQRKIGLTFRFYLVLIPLFFGLVFYWIYRKFVYYQSGKHTYDLCFYFRENGKPKRGVVFTLVTKRRMLPHPKKQPTAISNKKGCVCFKGVRGGRYWVKAVKKTTPPVKGYVKHLKDRRFVLKGKRGTVFRKKNQKRTIYFLESRGKR